MTKNQTHNGAISTCARSKSPRISRQLEKVVQEIVDDSVQLDLIRQLLNEKGLDPIWVRLVSAFGSAMYLRGLRETESTRKRSKSARPPIVDHEVLDAMAASAPRRSG